MINLFAYLLTAMSFVCYFLPGVVADANNISVRFYKLDSQGKRLPNSSSEWAVSKDDFTGLYWEVKTLDSSMHNHKNTYTWSTARENLVASLNETSFGGFSDWRLPTRNELMGIRQLGERTNLYKDFFPNTVPASYLSSQLAEPFPVEFGTSHTLDNTYYVRAVRGNIYRK